MTTRASPRGTHMPHGFVLWRRAGITMFGLLPFAAIAAPAPCSVTSGAQRTPVIELYTSEGCSSCPPADKWLSSLKGKAVVAQAFHVAYWDYIGWKDRFASPEFTQRQRDQAATQGLSGIYTPQLVRDGLDWRNWRQGSAAQPEGPAGAAITLRRSADANSFEAQVQPIDPNRHWAAYWTVTEHGHSSQVKAGENAGETLQHDFVVRQYVPVGRYTGKQTLQFTAIPQQADHPRQVNLVISDVQTHAPLQAVSLQCPM